MRAPEELRAVLSTIDYYEDVHLRVSGITEMRKTRQQLHIVTMRDLIENDPRYAQFSGLLQNFDDPAFNHSWSSKRELGHAQRCISSGDQWITTFGLSALTKAGDPTFYETRRKIYAECWDAAMVWTIGPFMLEVGKTFDEVMDWAASVTLEQDHRALRGLWELPIKKVFVLPDRFSSLAYGILPTTPPIQLHANYQPARAIARHLVTTGAV